MDRRSLLLGLALAPAFASTAFAKPAAKAATPKAIVEKIYAYALKEKGTKGMPFKFDSKKPLDPEFSSAMAAIWKKQAPLADKAGQSLVDFDIVANSQDPQIKNVKITVEKEDDTSATVAAAFEVGGVENEPSTPDVVRYDFVKENGAWKIDDVRGKVENDAWSFKAILSAPVQ